MANDSRGYNDIMTAFKGRTVPTGTQVFVYYNLHTRLWSIRATEGPHKGLVIAHAPFVRLHNVTAKVSQAGRQRVITEGKKNVHAGLCGTLEYHGSGGARPSDDSFPGLTEVTYNPYRYTTFVHKLNDTQHLECASVALLTTTRQVFVI
jgi:hypothetical protein